MARTINFAAIFSDFENFPAHWRTNRSAHQRQFSNLFNPRKGFSFPKKTLQTQSKSAYKRRRYLLLNKLRGRMVCPTRYAPPAFKNPTLQLYSWV